MHPKSLLFVSLHGGNGNYYYTPHMGGAAQLTNSNVDRPNGWLYIKSYQMNPAALRNALEGVNNVAQCDKVTLIPRAYYNVL